VDVLQDAEFVTSSRSKVTSLAGAIAGRVRTTTVITSVSIPRHKHYICLQARDQNTGALVEAIGEDAVATMVKAMAKARVFLEKDAIDLAVVITTEEVEKKGVDRVQRVLKNFRGKCYLEKCNM
jgi:stage V sporulation protein SpoVS